MNVEYVKSRWHMWFAWKPVLLNDGKRKWLCNIGRQQRVTHCDDTIMYFKFEDERYCSKEELFMKLLSE